MNYKYYDDMKQKLVEEISNIQGVVERTLKSNPRDTDKIIPLKRIQKDNLQMILDIDKFGNVIHVNDTIVNCNQNNPNLLQYKLKDQSRIIVKYNKLDPKYLKLKEAIENKESCIICTSDIPECMHRGTGKTSCITQLAYEFDLPIICKQSLHYLYTDRLKEFGYDGYTLKLKQFIRGTFPLGSIVLIDEQSIWNEEELQSLEKNNILIGFSRFFNITQ